MLLIYQIFMATSLVAGISMFVFTLGFKKLFRKEERICRYILSILLLYSVVIRFWLLLPGAPPVRNEASIVFDIFYITISVLLNIVLLKRLPNYQKRVRNKKGINYEPKRESDIK